MLLWLVLPLMGPRNMPAVVGTALQHLSRGLAMSDHDWTLVPTINMEYLVECSCGWATHGGTYQIAVEKIIRHQVEQGK